MVKKKKKDDVIGQSFQLKTTYVMEEICDNLIAHIWPFQEALSVKKNKERERLW